MRKDPTPASLRCTRFWLRQGWLSSGALACACAVATSPLVRDSESPHERDGVPHSQGSDRNDVPGQGELNMTPPGQMVWTDPQGRAFHTPLANDARLLLVFMPADVAASIELEQEIRAWLAQPSHAALEVLSIHCVPSATHRLPLADVDHYQHALDLQASLFLDLALTSMPTMVLVDANGRVLGQSDLATKAGPMLAKVLDEILQ